jgi:ribose/xylose/arabinose/galactoside ABC-type transport system permease subunit
VGLVVLVVALTAVSPNFFTATNINGILADSSMPVILAACTTFVIAVAGIDLSLASTVALSTTVLGAIVAQGGSVAEYVPAAVLTGAAVGAFNGLIIGQLRIPDFIVTLGSLGIGEGLALLISDGKPVVVSSGLFNVLNYDSLWIFRAQFLLALFIGLLLHLTLFRTRTGTHVLAVGGNRRASLAVGIRASRVKLFAYMVSGVGAGITAVVLTGYVGSTQPSPDTNSLLLAIAAVVLGGANLFGGRATISGSVIGAVLLTTLQDGLTFVGVSAYFQPIVIGVIVIGAAIAMRSQ